MPRLMVGSLYEALRSAGVDEFRARRAAEEMVERRKSLTNGFRQSLTQTTYLLAINIILNIFILLKLHALSACLP